MLAPSQVLLQAELAALKVSMHLGTTALTGLAAPGAIAGRMPRLATSVHGL